MRRPIMCTLALAVCLLLSGCNQVELAGLYLANNGTPVRLAKPLPLTLPYKDVDGWVL